jgi:TonB family protein
MVDERSDNPEQIKIELSPITIVSSSKVKMNISFGAVGSSVYVKLSGSGIGTNIVNIDDKVSFRLDNDTTVTGKSETLQTYDVEGVTSTYRHNYAIPFAALTALSKHNLKTLRKYRLDEFDEIAISKQNGRQVKNLAAFFVEELKKRNLFREDTLLLAERKNKPDSSAIKKEVIADAKPAFPGGEEVWSKFLKRNLRRPAELKAFETKIVQVQFLVKANGEVSNLEIVQSAGPAFDKEVLRVLKRMPYWKPAIEKGKPAEAIVKQSITFPDADSSAGL